MPKNYHDGVERIIHGIKVVWWIPYAIYVVHVLSDGLNSDGWVRLNGLYLIHHIFYIWKKLVTSGLKKGVTRVDPRTFPNNIITLYLRYPIGPTILLVRLPHI